MIPAFDRLLSCHPRFRTAHQHPGHTRDNYRAGAVLTNPPSRRIPPASSSKTTLHRHSNLAFRHALTRITYNQTRDCIQTSSRKARHEGTPRRLERTSRAPRRSLRRSFFGHSYVVFASNATVDVPVELQFDHESLSSDRRRSAIRTRPC